MPSLLGRVGGRKTPVVAIVFTTLVAFALVASGELDTLADTTVLLPVTQQEAAIWLRAGILLVVGLVLWGVNRAVSGPLESIEAEKLQA